MVLTISALLMMTSSNFQDQEPVVPIERKGRDGRGRDPWVFRCILEDRTRMLLIAPAPNWWIAFNPETCALHKVWQGKMDFRGKVWDFSQDNSRAEGRILFASPSEIWSYHPNSNSANWESDGIQFDNAFLVFEKAGSSLTSPVFSTKGWQRVFVAFDETGRRERFLISLSDNGGKDWKAQWFQSATHVTGESDWQWNFKLISFTSDTTRLRVSKPTGIGTKKLRALRMYGDRPTWFDREGKAVVTKFDGYELISQTKGVRIKFRLRVGGKEVNVIHQPTLMPSGWNETITIQGMPHSQRLQFRREGLSLSIDGPEKLTFDHDGVYDLNYKIKESTH